MQALENVENQTIITENQTENEVTAEMEAKPETLAQASVETTTAGTVPNETTATTAVTVDNDIVYYRETVVTILIVQTFIISAIFGALIFGKFLGRFK